MINANKVELWKSDVAASVEMYNDWFFRAAPEAFRASRQTSIDCVLQALQATRQARDITPEVIKNDPSVTSVLRMMTAPPIARDRLVGLSGINSRSFIKTLEDGHLPVRMESATLDSELRLVCTTISRLLDLDLMPWLAAKTDPDERQMQMAATVVADRLCGSVADPIIRNAQEERQLRAIAKYLDSLGYLHIALSSGQTFRDMWEGTYSFRTNVPVGDGLSVNLPVDVVIQPKVPHASGYPILIECKSAGDYTNTNKRRKEEAQKVRQLRTTYGIDICFALFLCGYFDSGYLGYEAAEGIDWIWEHRIDDLKGLGL
ncbi:MAG: XamI family restriction endonuclease [Propionibacteriaceae bacterium]|jgi:hypothetical protein|nr:XamI family restriction endonuclease [Propionibacteriaceae bacterium]